MTLEPRWWDGPWPWLTYLATYAIPWWWVRPSATQLLLSGIVIAIFVPVYVASFHLRRRRLALAIAVMTGIAIAAAPSGGGWTAFSIYPAMQAARLTPRRSGAILIAGTLIAFLAAGFAWGQPLVWWLPSLLMPALLGGAALSREAFIERSRALLRTQEEVRRLAGVVERERMARDLHDTVGRTLTLVALKADLVARLAEHDAAAAGDEARLIAAEARAGIKQVGDALEGGTGGSLAREIAASCDALVDAGVEPILRGDGSAVSRDAGAVLAMALREAVTNVIRHASARTCTVEVASEDGWARLTVADDGVGGPLEYGNGLDGMRQRILAAGGTLTTADRRPGIAVTATIPS